MHAYLELLKMKGVQQLLISSIPARLAYGMISLGIFFKVQNTTSSISIAGLAVGLNALASSLSVGLRSAFIDKYGFKCPLGVRGRRSDNDLYRKKMGWEVSEPLIDGMRKTFTWIDEQVKKEK